MKALGFDGPLPSTNPLSQADVAIEEVQAGVSDRHPIDRFIAPCFFAVREKTPLDPGNFRERIGQFWINYGGYHEKNLSQIA